MGRLGVEITWRFADMYTYRELFRTPEFTPLFTASCAQVASTTLNGLALATLVYDRTDSALLAALAAYGWRGTRTATGSATSAAPKGSSSDWPSSSADDASRPTCDQIRFWAKKDHNERDDRATVRDH
ncbi:hypothetical protein [Nonomuraea polychroma]|uniref:hypothetical protein n=1 Tax=Nonomuraea polychroma TaxID=46176 RepID=UPI0019D492EF|nr:hypothetical protein [Nonomuraea polychroma]